ncbi:phytoene desaturase family protein [Williamsia sp. CHRR-6]|uniref:phytoene desaturase family protein n=1 Tax=Williamsia sp. CHRR-6 TaxID=2835871 RepID=UPI001BD9DBB8|nr:phytoene desaturase family protein [Williamsia sp. CHRR-6]MBT0565280.1 phytoene desaturase [Williamsia sp. CHRR-6]
MSGIRTVEGPIGHVVVVGAGLAGLSAALHLRGQGIDVTVLEAGPTPGGRVRTEEIDGHLFDTGASVLTMPSLIEAPLAAAGMAPERTRELLDLTDLDPTYQLRYADGTDFSVARNPEQLAANIGATFGPAQEAGFRKLRTWLQELYDVEMDDFIDRNVDGIADYLTQPDLRTGVKKLVTMGAVRRLTPAIARFISDTRLQRAFTFQALYAGVPPAKAPAIYAVISHMDIGMGVYYPRGGMGRVGAVMAQGLVEAGGVISYDTPARHIRFAGAGARPRAVAVQTASGDIACDAVIVTTDQPVTETLLANAPAKKRKIRYSPSAVVSHMAVPVEHTRSWPGGHHTIDFGAAWDETFVELTSRPGQLMSDPSLLLNRPALTDPDNFIRDGLESVTVLAPCPNLESADLPWDHLAEPYVAEVCGVLEQRGYTGITAGLTSGQVKRIDHPGVWAQQGMSVGTPFAAAHTLLQTGPLRAPNLWPGAANVVIAGSTTVPGVGMPPVLVSGRLAAERITGSTRR